MLGWSRVDVILFFLHKGVQYSGYGIDVSIYKETSSKIYIACVIYWEVNNGHSTKKDQYGGNVILMEFFIYLYFDIKHTHSIKSVWVV